MAINAFTDEVKVLPDVTMGEELAVAGRGTIDMLASYPPRFRSLGISEGW